MITCSDVIENLYFYGLEEADKYATGTDWALGLLQSLLGGVLRITAITNDLIKMNENNITDIPKTLYYAGEILNMLLVFDPVHADLQKLISTDVHIPTVSVSDALQSKHDIYSQKGYKSSPIVRMSEEDNYPTPYEGKTGRE